MLLFQACSNHESHKSDLPLNYNQHISTIIRTRCAGCHQPGSGAPFNLNNYKDVINHLKTIQLSINERLMPPWPADTSYSQFRGQKSMTAEEITLVNNWIREGALEGPAINSLTGNNKRNSLSKNIADFSVTMKTFHISGNNKDNFIMLKIPIELPADTFLRAVEIIPGNKKLVHHVNAHIVQYNDGSKRTLTSGKDFVNTELVDKLQAYKILDLQNDDGTYPLLTPSVSNYLPGVELTNYPDGIGGYCIKKKSVILLDNIHYGPSPIDTTDQTTINLYFQSHPPIRPTTDLILGTSGVSPVEPVLSIPANEIKSFRTHFVVHENISLLTLNPHMHLLGSNFKAYAITPERDTIHLIYIPKWDFRWQYFYTFKKIVKIPAGTTIIVEATFDNTENNPLNPFHPPRRISERNGSMRTTDEMFQLICTYLPYKMNDEKINLESK